MKKGLKALLLAALAMAVLFPVLNCKKEPEEISVRLKWVYATGFAGDMVALKKGIFAKNGLDVTLHEGAYNLDPIKLVASGSDQIGTAGADQVLLARAQGIPLVVIAVVFQSSPVVFIAKQESGIKTPQDFVGHKIGIKPGADPMPIYEALMKKEGIDRTKLKEIPVQYSYAPLLEGQVDVFPGWTTNECFQFDKMGLKYTCVDPREYGIEPYAMCYFTTEKFLKEHPDIVEKYLKSVLEGYKWTFENPEEALSVILSFSEKLDTAQERYLIGAMKPYILDVPDEKIGWMERSRWEETQQVYLDAEMLEKPLDLDSLYTMKFLEKIYK